jgi:deaminated glutathione amidase
VKVIKTAVIQMDSSNDKEQNIATALRLCNEAIQQKANFIALPEMFNLRLEKYSSDETESIPGPSLMPFIDFAKTNNVYILAGSIAEHVPGTDRCLNTSVLIDNNGNINARYSKIHLFDVDIDNKKIEESKSYIPGKEAVLGSVFNIPVGLSICFDLRFPKLYRSYFEKGAKILCVPASFTKTTGEAHWEMLLRARAIENQCFVIAPNQIGIGPGHISSYGNSLIIDPWGSILSRGSSDKEEILIADLDLKQLDIIRNNMPLSLIE